LLKKVFNGLLVWYKRCHKIFLMNYYFCCRVFGMPVDKSPHQKGLEEERDASLKLLQIINGSNQLHELMQSATLLLRNWSDCEAVGIRLRQDGDFPYFETRGFSEEFVRAENKLCIYDSNGQPERDSAGNPALECMCGNILFGRFDPAKSFFTSHGSFWTNSTTELLKNTSEADRLARTRNRCNGEGYESVALIPLRVGQEIYGLLQMNDKRRNCFTAEKIALIERLSNSLAIGIAHRASQQEILKSEAKFRSYIEHAPLGIALVNQLGEYLEVNPAMSKIFGYTQSELLRMKVFDLQDSEDSQTFRKVKETSSVTSEILLRKKDGTKLWSLMNAVKIAEDRFLGFLQDITANKNTERNLVASEAELMAIYNNIPIIMCLLDEDRRVVHLNQAAVRFAGRPESELLGLRGGEMLSCIHASDDPRGCGFGPDCLQCQLRVAVQDSIQTGKTHSGIEAKVGFVHQGQIKTVWVNASTARLEIIGQVRILLCLEDVTDRKLAITKLQEQAALLDASHDGVLVCDLADRIQYMNMAAEELIGWKFSEVESAPIDRALKTLRKGQLGEVKQRTISKGVWSGELNLLAKDGKQIVVDSRWTLVRDSQNVPQSLLIVNSDITKKKELESQYLRAQRLESLGTLASGIAHDLNNVLSPLLLGGSALESQLAGEEDQIILATMMDAARRGADTVKQLLTFARGGTGDRSLVQPRSLLQEISRLLRQTMPKNIQVYTDYAADLNSLMADPSQLHQVLMNLCVNARDAMPNGGVLSIAIENALLDEHAKLVHPKAAPGAYLVFKVSDTGSGIKPELMDRIFDPFFTTKSQEMGTGLGLATVLGIIAGHGGFILVDSQLNRGTAFSIYLPALKPTKDEARSGFSRISLTGRDELILVVDDEAAIGRILQDLLTRHGYNAISASSAPEGLELFRNNQKSVRAVITDMMMPFVSGQELIVQLRALSPEIKIIAISGLATNSKKEEAIAAGVDAFLYKPVEAEKLLTVLYNLLQSTSSGGEAIVHDGK
jgi:PAS domain S-box-containing protein